MVAKWDAPIAEAPDRVSETKDGFKLDSSEKLGVALARDATGNLMSVRFTFGSGPKATFIQDDYSDFRDSKERAVPHQRIRTFSPRPDGTPDNPMQHCVLQSIQWNPPDAVESLSSLRSRAVFEKKDVFGNVYAPDGRLKYNEKKLMADMVAATTGSQTRRSWATWIVGTLVVGVVGLIVLKYRKAGSKVRQEKAFFVEPIAAGLDAAKRSMEPNRHHDIARATECPGFEIAARIRSNRSRLADTARKGGATRLPRGRVMNTRARRTPARTR